MAEQFESVDAYIASFPAATQATLQEMRQRIHAALPGSGEKISYNIAAVTVDGRTVVHFAGWAKHVSMYPIPAVDAALAAETAPYLAGRGTMKFPLNRPIPYDLIERLGEEGDDAGSYHEQRSLAGEAVGCAAGRKRYDGRGDVVSGVEGQRDLGRALQPMPGVSRSVARRISNVAARFPISNTANAPSSRPS